MFRNSLTHVKEMSKKLYYNNLFETNKANAKKVWQGINDLLRRRKNKTFSLTKLLRLMAESSLMAMKFVITSMTISPQ